MTAIPSATRSLGPCAREKNAQRHQNAGGLGYLCQTVGEDAHKGLGYFRQLLSI
jgi:hypothetical protein